MLHTRFVVSVIYELCTAAHIFHLIAASSAATILSHRRPNASHLSHPSLIRPYLQASIPCVLPASLVTPFIKNYSRPRLHSSNIICSPKTQPSPIQPPKRTPPLPPSIMNHSPAFCTPLPLPLSARPPLRPPISRITAKSSNHPPPHGPTRRSKRPNFPTTHRNAPAPLSQSLYDRALCLSARADKRPARELFRSATHTHPEDPRLWLAWARMEARLGRYQSARDIFHHAVDMHPQNVRMLHAWAVMEDRAGEVRRARVLFRRCLDLDSSDGLVWQSYALAEERAGRTERARQLFGRGVVEAGGNASLWSTWAVLEHRHGCLERACELFESAVERDSTHVRSLQSWAIAEEKLGRMGKSAELFERALAVKPSSAPTCQAYGLFEARRGRLEKARELFLRGIQVDPDHAAIWHAWAVMEQREGNYDRARELFDKGVAAAPNSTAMLRGWAAMELELGHIDKSDEWRVPSRGFRGWSKEKRRSSVARKRRNPKEMEKQLSTVGENLRMLRLMIERRSDEDVKTVMQWLDRRARTDRRLYDALAERRDKDSRMVKEWVARRSASDIEAFTEWVDENYKKDSRLGVYLFNWHMPPARIRATVPVAVAGRGRKVEKPEEWFMLAERPKMSLKTADEQMYMREEYPDYADGIHWLGQIAESLVDRVALVTVLGAMSLVLAGASAHMAGNGYSPAGQNGQSLAEQTETAVRWTGVDAYLYEEGGAELAANRSAHKAKPSLHQQSESFDAM
eukprot:GFKZ01009905.1.p1 GENE.GFKZ01009905.1~~GFKZ01009905.1.p1  ORF type:complete len:743 (+),score=98.63 GFKZ01009905.1:402-2630(+)